jgi:hypothetical protein
MSRAVVICSSSGRPEAFLKIVAGMPSWRLLRHELGEPLSLPAMCSAIATATSLALLVMSALMASISDSPSARSSLVGAAPRRWRRS